MNTRQIEQIANAVLYEGYILYPYRASAVKNRKRFNFGVLYPSAYREARDGTAAASMQTECLVGGDPSAELEIKVRFLQLVARVAGKLPVPLAELRVGEPADFSAVDSLEVRGKHYPSWQEAAEREVTVPACCLCEIATQPTRREFSFPAAESIEPLRDESGQVVAVLARKQEAIEGLVAISAAPAETDSGIAAAAQSAGESIYRVTVRVSNLTAFEASDNADAALARALVSTHTLLGIGGGEGEFFSLLDPPEFFKDAAAACRNVGTFPVLVGEDGRRDAMLSSPIILYDYPQVAAESAGQFFDGTEIDEMLALRIMTLTDGEKREMSQTDEMARELLERTEALPPEHLMKLHGVLRGLHPVGPAAPAESPEEERP